MEEKDRRIQELELSLSNQVANSQLRFLVDLMLMIVGCLSVISAVLYHFDDGNADNHNMTKMALLILFCENS